MQLKLRSYLYIRKKHKSHFCSSLFVSLSINQDDADMSLWTNVNSVDDIWQQQPVDCCHQHQHYREDIKKKTYSSCAQRQSGHFNRPKGDKVRVDKRETQRERESDHLNLIYLIQTCTPPFIILFILFLC